MLQDPIFSYETQSLGLEGVANARQLGSYIGANGRKIKNGLLFRSGVLSSATDNDKIILSEKYGVKYVYDLRTAIELKHEPDGNIPGATYINMPVEDADNNIWKKMFACDGATQHDQLLLFSHYEEANRMVRKMYTGYVADEFCQLQYAAFLDSLLRTEGPVLWHCAQGKDRTGLAAAFLLAALGVDRETIILDFCLTNTPYQPTVNKLVARLKEHDTQNGISFDVTIRAIEVIQAMEGVCVEFFIAALDYIDTIYGSMDRYLHTILALTDDEIKTLRDKFLE